MIKILNCSIAEFIKIAKNKEVYLYGAGRAAGKCIDLCIDSKINIQSLIDKNSNSYVNGFEYYGNKYEVIGIGDFIEKNLFSLFHLYVL